MTVKMNSVIIIFKTSVIITSCIAKDKTRFDFNMHISFEDTSNNSCIIMAFASVKDSSNLCHHKFFISAIKLLKMSLTDEL